MEIFLPPLSPQSCLLTLSSASRQVWEDTVQAQPQDLPTTDCFLVTTSRLATTLDCRAAESTQATTRPVLAWVRHSLECHPVGANSTLASMEDPPPCLAVLALTVTLVTFHVSASHQYPSWRLLSPMAHLLPSAIRLVPSGCTTSQVTWTRSRSHFMVSLNTTEQLHSHV